AGNGDAFDNWKGTLGFVDVERNSEYDNPSGHVILNYNSGKDEWIRKLPLPFTFVIKEFSL
ncbi:unnamed protein product, partial [marine sediment metagenome]